MSGESTKIAINPKHIHSIIGVGIMVFFRFLPLPLPEVTDVGITVLGIFLGTLYLWITVDALWPSLLCFAMLVFSGYAPPGQVMNNFLGNPVLLLAWFMMLLAGAMTAHKINPYIGRFFLTLKVTRGRPWVFAFMICLGCFLMSIFVHYLAPIFLFWPVLYDIFKDVGYTNKDKFPKIMIILVIVGTILGFPVAPFKQNGLALISNYKAITENLDTGAIIVNNGAYFLSTFAIGLILLVAIILFAKYILKPDVSKLKTLDPEILRADPLPPMTLQQKIISIGYVILIAAMLLPSMLPNWIPGFEFLAKNLMLLPLLLTVILAALSIKKTPVLDVQKTMEHVSWPIIFMIGAALLLAGALTSEATGITAFLNVLLTPVFSGMSTLVFTIVLLVIGCVLTNFCNSLVIGLVLQPFIMSYCMATGANPVPLVILLAFVVLATAICTPAASPFAAILHGNKEWLSSKDIYKYTPGIVLVMMVGVLVLGIPIVNFFSILLP